MIGLLKEPKNDYSDFYDQARFTLTWRISCAILYAMIIFIVVTIFLVPEYIAVVGVSLFAIVVIVYLLWRTGKYNFSAKLFLTLGVLVSSVQLFLINDMVHIIDIVWYLSIVIFGYFVLGKTWGIAGLSAFAISISAYVFFMLELNIDQLREVTLIVKVFQIVNGILASIVLGYIIHHFIETNKYAEQKIQGVNMDLLEKKSIIESQNDLHVIMLKEIHHRVKNNLQIISSLLRLQSLEIKNEESKEYFTDSINRIGTMALIHEKLYQTDLVKVDVKGYFIDLTNELKKTYASEHIDLVIELNVDVEELGLDTLVPLALLYNELFSNSIKHGFKNSNNGKIAIELKRKKDNRLDFNYADNGVWKESINEGSFGLEMVDTFTEQLEGSYERTILDGTFYQFDLSCID